jgi:hypothetical protein
MAVGIRVHAYTVRLVRRMSLMLEGVMTGWMLVLIWPVVRLSIWLLVLVVLVLEVMWWMLRIVLLELLMRQIGLVVVITEPTAHPSQIRGHVPRRLTWPWRAKARHARNAGVLHVYRRSVHPVHMLLMLGLMRVRVLAIRHAPRRTGVEIWWLGLIWVLDVVVRIVDRWLVAGRVIPVSVTVPMSVEMSATDWTRHVRPGAPARARPNGSSVAMAIHAARARRPEIGHLRRARILRREQSVIGDAVRLE